MESCCCHFPIDDYALRDSSDLLSVTCTIKCTGGVGVIGKPLASRWWQVQPVAWRQRTIINGETDGR